MIIVAKILALSAGGLLVWVALRTLLRGAEPSSMYRVCDRCRKERWCLRQRSSWLCQRECAAVGYDSVVGGA